MPGLGPYADTNGVISSSELPSGGLTGRSAETAAIRRAVSRSPVVTVTGLPGVGKTATSIAAALGIDTVPAGFPDGLALIRLDGLRDETLLPHTVAAALLLPDAFDVSPHRAVTAALRGKRMLLLLDTCEHLLGAVAAFASELTEACPGVRILATSREPLRVPGEETIYLAPLPMGDAVELFRQRAGGVPLDSDALEAVCEQLDRLPLAIVLAARQLSVGSLDALRAGLESGYDFLSDPGAQVARHQTLAAAIGWSHQLCTPAERLLWARLAVFEGAFGVKDCQEVCATTYLTDANVEVGVTMLAERSLLLHVTSELPRYVMPHTIRAYGLAMLRRIAEEDEMRRRYRRWRSGPRRDASVWL
jgi:predicted ATPase